MKMRITGYWILLFVLALPCVQTRGAGTAGESTTQESSPSVRLTIVNNADTPVYATAVSVAATTLAQALGLAPGTPVEAVTATGDVLPFFPDAEDGGTAVRCYLSLQGGERLELQVRQAAQWGRTAQMATARFDANTGVGVLANGVVRFELRGFRWSLAFAGPQADRIARLADRQILRDCGPDFWLDSERRGRLLGLSHETVKATGLIHAQEANLAGGEATVNPDGSATLRITRRFAGFAKDITWTEDFSLLPGQPVLIVRDSLETPGSAKRYVAFVEHGGGIRGSYGNLLLGQLRFGYKDPKAPTRFLLAGAENGPLRIGWRGEKCWAAADSDLGNGIAISTTSAITHGIPGSRIWGIASSGFFVSFIDPEQENFPYAFSAGKSLELGFAFAASCGGIGMWHQARQLFAGVTQGRTPPLSSSCSVYLGTVPLQAGEASGLADVFGADSKMMAAGTVRKLAMTVDFQRPCLLSAAGEWAAAKGPILLQVRPWEEAGTPMTVMTLEEPGPKQVDFTGVTRWAGTRQAFVLEVLQPEGARLTALTLAPAGFPAPEPETPTDGMSLTDLAVFFRWKQVAGALDYELQLARSDEFLDSVTRIVRSEIDRPYHLPADSELPKPGTWFWRVRAVEPGRPGAWSAIRRFAVNDDHAKQPVPTVVSPEHPLFTMEACRVTDLSLFTDTIPADLKPYVVFNCGTKFDPVAYLKPLHAAGIAAFVRTHGPGVMSYWMPLADVEAVFQAYPNVIGIMGGETLSTHYHRGANQTYVNRLLKLCGKYGRIYYDADGTYPVENKWQELYAKEEALMKEYAGYLIFAQKNNILHRQFVSQSSVLGLYLSDAILAQGAWEDGGWYWEQVGFRKLGEILGQRGGTTGMPRNFWNLTFLMGVSRGCSVFSFEGQTGTIPVPKGYRISEKGLPGNANPTAHWTNQGELTPAFHRFMAPFIRAVIRHQLVPTKAQVLDAIRLGVYNDGIPRKADGDPYYYEWDALYRGTYGFRDVGTIPGTLMEFFPNTGRYHYVPVFPQGKVDVKGIEMVPLSQLMDTSAVKARFDAAYPEWYSGDALVTLVGDTLAVLNSHENTDVTERYAVPFNRRGAFQEISGSVAPHAYLMGKFEDGDKRLWLQANVEYPERDTELTVTCGRKPAVTVTPESAVKVNRWDEVTGKLTLHLAHADGAVEVELRP